ncbi:FliI/YscN family ATPase [Marivita hallyeonensis]|uniref:Flagellum-specific ATP synthase n=1 Tax=Marivita hallyeonensis TaxID=996342 RepID=A0A1M5ULT4_9RHOB|nr:FliI/YscN family ATPase [Marivita hallyeonensis]SHH63965.1 flagellum-specific ATP synthase [Marivita hallyeonensis]
MQNAALKHLLDRVSEIPQSRAFGRVQSVDGHLIRIAGLEDRVQLGDRLRLFRRVAGALDGEVLRIDTETITMLPDKAADQVSLSDQVISLGRAPISPCEDWLGRILDPFGSPLDDGPLPVGDRALDVVCDPPPALARKPFGGRLETGFHIFNTMLPIARGQRIGIFAGSGVGKSSLLADLMKSVEADVVVLALVGERGREVRHFTEMVLGMDGLARSVVVAATADAPPTVRCRCALTAMRVAEYFRDEGRHVLLVIDSITRFAEAHREVAISAGEFPSLRGFPASTPAKIAGLVERSGTGRVGGGDITSIFSVLVAGSDMNEPVADMLRGILDGHIILDRALAEQGHFPAVDLLASVSRSLTDVASDAENEVITKARALAARYAESSPLIRTGLYEVGSDPEIDQSVAFHTLFQDFLKGKTDAGVAGSFQKLSLLLRRCGALGQSMTADPSLALDPIRASGSGALLTTKE